MVNISDEANNSEIIATYILKELDYEILYSSGLETRKMVMGLNYARARDKEIAPHYRKIVGGLKGLRSTEERKKRMQEARQEMLKENPNMIFPSDSKVFRIRSFIRNILHIKNRHGSFIGDILCQKDGKGYLFDVKLKFFKENKNLNAFWATANEVLNYDLLTKLGKVPVKILINLKKDDKYYYGIFDWNDFTYSKNFDPHKSLGTSIRLRDGFDTSKLKKFENVRNYKFEKYLDLSKIKRKKYLDENGNMITSYALRYGKFI